MSLRALRARSLGWGASKQQSRHAPEQGAVVARCRELMTFARRQGYKPDEVIRIIQQLG